MSRSGTQHLAAESADLQTISVTGAKSQLAHSPGSSPIPEGQISDARIDSSTDCSQSESRIGDGKRQQAAVERAEFGGHAAASWIDSSSAGGLGQLLSEQQLWDAAWRAFEPHKVHQHLSSPDRPPNGSGRDAVKRKSFPSSFPSLAARLFGSGSRSRQRDQRCAQSAECAKSSSSGVSFACHYSHLADAAGGRKGHRAHAPASIEP